MVQPIIHPRIVELRGEIQALRNELRECSDEWHRLTVLERPRLTALYSSCFGDLERKLQVLAVSNAELFRRIELLTIKVTRGERLTPETIDYVNMVVDRAYDRFRRRLQETFDMTTEERNAASSATQSDGELVSMYRTLAKKLHPDSGADPDVTQNTWHQVQSAYAARNTAQLASLMAVWESRVADDIVLGSMDADVLAEERDRLTAHVRREKRKLERLQSEEPFVHASLLEDPSWQDAHRASLLSAIDAKSQEWAKNKQRYQEITGSVDVPGQTKPTSDDGDDFMNATYFGQR
jgi:hypothetical protein